MKLALRTEEPLHSKALVESIGRIAGVAKEHHRSDTLREEATRNLLDEGAT